MREVGQGAEKGAGWAERGEPEASGGSRVPAAGREAGEGLGGRGRSVSAATEQFSSPPSVKKGGSALPPLPTAQGQAGSPAGAAALLPSGLPAGPCPLGRACE